MSTHALDRSIDFGATIPLTNESRYLAWLLAAQERVTRSGNGRHELPSPAAARPHLVRHKARFVGHSQVFLDFKWMINDG